MKYIIISLILCLLLILVCYYLWRKRWAIRKVKCTTEEEKLCYINMALSPFGFEFDSNSDIVISKNDAWQRDVGYMDLYDMTAPFFNMVMDSQPIYFDYDEKHYRMEFWKGQYGITTGAEIGIYIQDHGCSSINKIYRCARDDERLNMTFLLNKDCKLFSRCDTSWWLTGFDVGVFSKPKDLKMDVCVEFPNCDMKDVFVGALNLAGYSYDNISVKDNIVCFEYCCPSYYKPNCSHHIIKCFVQICNYINCHFYMWMTRFFNRTIDKLTYLRFMAPCIYRFIIHLCIPRRNKKCYCKK